MEVISENQARQCADDRVTLPTATGARDWRARSAKAERLRQSMRIDFSTASGGYFEKSVLNRKGASSTVWSRDY